MAEHASGLAGSPRRVFCCFNLHRRCYSLRALDGAERGRVIAHASQAQLSRVEFKVSQVGRERVIRERQKNVHAGVVGLLEGYVPFQATDKASPLRKPRRAEKVTYNPYRYASFVRVSDEAALAGARRCVLTEEGVWAEGLSFFREAGHSGPLEV